LRHKRVTDSIREQAALYGLGLLPPAEAREFEEHVRSGCAVCESELRGFEETTALLPLALPERAPHSRVREKLLARIRPQPERPGPQVWKAWSPVFSDLHVVRAGQGAWQSVGVEGVSVKRLYVDPTGDNVTMLVRMEPGSIYPAHRHGGPEQCFVLEGDLSVGDVVLHAGDYQCASLHSSHDVTRTERGCLLLIVSSQHDELLA
jgi:putative transcriptional regulator